MTSPDTLKDHEGLTREKLLELEKPDLVELLLIALESQQLATKNIQTVNDLLGQTATRVSELEGANKVLEAELIVLRNKP